MNLIETIAKRVAEKPMPSLAATQILKVIEDENHSLKDIVKIVETDASLTAEVLKVANSAAFYRGNPATTVNRAILLMGEMMVVGVAICASSSIVFHRPLEGYESGAGEMWDHSLRSAIASREITHFSRTTLSSGLAFTAGLLHDIGKSVISEFLKGNTKNATNLFESGKAENYLEAEKDILGTDHAQVGYSMAQHWGLPEALCIAIRDHHHPSDSKEEHRGLVYAVHLGDIISMIGGGGTGSDSLAYKMDNGYEEYFKIDKSTFSRILLRVQEHFTSLKESIVAKGTTYK